MFGIKKDRNKVDAVLNEIREDYNLLASKYNHSNSLLKQFEYRYHDAIEYRMDLKRFLSAEQEAVKAMIDKAESKASPSGSPVKEKKAEAAVKAEQADEVEGKKKISFADRMIEEFEERIKKYPEIIIHPDASFEIKKLFGALSCVEKDYWGMVDRALRNNAGSKRFSDTIDIEPEINRQCISGTNGIPPALGTYLTLLERVPRDSRAVEREEKRCLVNAAVLLKRLQMEIIRALDLASSNPDENSKESLTEAKVYIDGMIDDFRLKDLAQLN